MNKICAVVLMILILSGCTLPSDRDTGPMVWIDRPLDGESFPLAPLILQAHAADANGISTIEFLVSDDLIGNVTTGGARLEEASIEWMPPEPGIYMLNARAIDTQGNTNARTMASVQISVGTATLSTILPTSPPAADLSATPTANLSETSTPSPLVTLTMTSGPVLTLEQNANCRLGPSTSYDAVDALLQGEIVIIEGRNEENTWFWVRKPSGSGNCWVSASTGAASGNWQIVQVVAAPVPPVVKVTPMLPATATPTPADFTPPTISNISINPTNVAQAGCGTPDTLIISAIVTDASGIANVIYEVTGPGPMDAGDGYLLPMGGDQYQATVGPIAGSAGTWTIKIYATDMLQNVSEAGPWTFQVVCLY